MRAFSSVLLAASAGCALANNDGAHVLDGRPLSALDVDETEQLLKEWQLHGAFGEQFRELGVNGEMLAAYEPGDLDAAAFPTAQKLHWKVLDRRIHSARRLNPDPVVDAVVADHEDRDRRRASAAATPRSRQLVVDEAGYSGLQIVSNKSMIAFGSAKDVSLKRVSEGVLELLGELQLRASADEVVNIGAVLASLQLKDLGYPPDGLCLPSCAEFKDRYPNAETGTYCITVGGSPTDLHCDMETMGGGWTYVSRGTDSSNGCQKLAFGDIAVDPTENTRWSLGQVAINALAHTCVDRWMDGWMDGGCGHTGHGRAGWARRVSRVRAVCLQYFSCWCCRCCCCDGCRRCLSMPSPLSLMLLLLSLLLLAAVAVPPAVGTTTWSTSSRLAKTTTATTSRARRTACTASPTRTA